VGIRLIAAIRLTLSVQFFLHQVQLLEGVKSFIVLVCLELDVFALFSGHLFIVVESEGEFLHA
jgi:hypothetical protein